MSSKNQPRQVKIKNKVKKNKAERNGSKLCQLKSFNSNTIDNISISENNASLKQPLMPLLNTKQLKSNEKMDIILYRLPELVKFMPNSVMMSLMTYDETSLHKMANVQLDRVQWKLELMLSSIYERKNKIEDNLQSLLSVTITDDNQIFSVGENSKQTVVESKAVPVNEEDYEIDVPNESISNPFWKFAQNYFAPVSKDDLIWLRNSVLSYNKDLAKIPPLGKHFTKVRDNKCTQNNQPSDHTQQDKSIQQITSNEVNNVNHAVHIDNVLTPLFQSIASTSKEHSNTPGEDNTEKNIEPQDMSNSSVIPPAISELEIDSDEILEELIKCDTALIKLQENNQHNLTMLFKKCYIDYRKNEIYAKINKVNEEILKYNKQSDKTKLKQNEQKSNEPRGKEKYKLKLLLDERSKYLLELSEFLESEISVPRMLNDTLSSDEESISI